MFTAYISSLLGYGIWNTLLVRYPVSRVTPFALLIPVAGLLAAWIAQGEIPTPIEACGGGLLLAGVAITTLRRRTQPASNVAAHAHIHAQDDGNLPATAGQHH
jgi:O-acetylserine/cysteine efflux transporter